MLYVLSLKYNNFSFSFRFNASLSKVRMDKVAATMAAMTEADCSKLDHILKVCTADNCLNTFGFRRLIYTSELQ